MGRSRRSLSAAAAVALAAASMTCRPDLGPADSLVQEPRILAVRGEPPEVEPGQSAHFDLLLASRDATADPSGAAWAMCTTPKPLTENDIVNAACASGSGTSSAGTGAAVDAVVPGDACALFGPDPPPGGYRPRDPDATGGYYQPVRAQVPATDVAFALERVLCNLANAPADAARAYATTYTPNRNPRLLPLVATTGGDPVDLAAVPTGARVTLEASWTGDSAESYVTFDPSSQSLVGRREALRVSWFATAGSFDGDRTGRDEGDPASTSDNGWTAPSTPGVVHLWLVLRDSRGGVDFARYDVTVGP